MPERLPWSYIAKLQQLSDAEHFKVGDKYDLILGCGMTATVTLTTIVGTEGDEPVGNDSYIGALASLDDSDKEFLLSRNYYVVRRHREPMVTSLLPLDQQLVGAGIENEGGHEPVRVRHSNSDSRSVNSAHANYSDRSRAARGARNFASI